MVSRESVIDALRRVNDPELRRSLVELDMIRDVTIRGGQVAVTVALTVPGCPLRNTIEQDVRAALQALPGVEQVEVHMTAMTDEERRELSRRLWGDQPGDAGILDPGSDTEAIAVASGKGGVGKSTVAVNLAVTLAAMGHRVGIIDADIYGFSVPGLLGVSRVPTVIDNMIIPVPAHGVSVMSMEFFLQENRPVLWRGPMLGKMLREFFRRVYWGELDYLVLDLPPGTGDVALDVHQLLPASREIVVTTPHPTATHVAYRAGRMAIDTNHEIIGVVENMSYFRAPDTGKVYHIFGEGGGDRLAEQLGVPLLARIPLGNPQIPGTGLFVEGSEAHEAIRRVAEACVRAR
ncbi:MAG: Mrp/NBP35 family ATP-binding protein [Bacillota bacterium]|nr:MRP family ATP-binding protein [Bacillota bacterium]